MARKQLGSPPLDSMDAATVDFVQANKGTSSTNSAPGDPLPSYVSGTHPGRYDATSNLYNVKTAQFRLLRAKLAQVRAGSGSVRVAFWGDSITAGETANPYATNSPTVRALNALINSGYPPSGTGFVFSHNGQSGQDERITTTGTGWTQYGQTIDYSQNAGDTRTFTADRAGTIVDVYYNDSNSGNFTVTIDNGAPQTVTLGGTATNKVATFTGLPNVQHTVRVTNTASGYTVLVNGFCVRSNTGVIFDNFGVGGSNAGDWSNTGGLGLGTIALSGAIADLVVLNIMANDVLQNVGAATFKTNLNNVITRIQNAGSPVMLVAGVPNGGGDDTAYRNAIYELADTYALPLLDLRDRWGTPGLAVSQGLLTSGQVHPTAAGYADMGSAYANAFVQDGLTGKQVGQVAVSRFNPNLTTPGLWIQIDQAGNPITMWLENGI